MNALIKKTIQKYTIESYLALEEQSEEKYEYANGMVWAMSGGTRNHSKIGTNLTYALTKTLREKGKSCTAFNSDLKVHVEQYQAFLYPDAFVICGEEEYYNNRKDIVTNPILIIEVLSKSTAQYDQTDKFRKYRSIPSFKEYILIDQDRASIEGFYRETKDYWRIQSIRGVEESLYLHSIDCTLLLRDIYWQVVLKTPTEGIDLP